MLLWASKEIEVVGLNLLPLLLIIVLLSTIQLVSLSTKQVLVTFTRLAIQLISVEPNYIMVHILVSIMVFGGSLHNVSDNKSKCNRRVKSKPYHLLSNHRIDDIKRLKG